jgi:periplasmic protein TonB
MRPAVPLYEFMPYGAPELLESRQRHMSRALVLTSAVALALYALTRGVASLLPAPSIAPTHVVFEPEPFVITQPPVDVKPPSPQVKAAPVTHPAAPPVPVSDKVAPPNNEVISPSTAKTDDVGTGPLIATSEAGTAGPVVETLPEFGKWVYVESEPAPITEVKPEYPSIAMQAGVEGRVTVHVLVGKEGRVLDAVLARNVQVPMLNEAALAAARRWVFTPGYANGHAVACWTAIPFHFRLH